MNIFLESMEFKIDGRRITLNTKLKIKYDNDAMFELDEIFLYIKDELKEDKLAEKIVKKIKERI